MAAPTDVLTRIDEIESELRGLSVELREIRTIVTQAAVAPAADRARVADHPAGDRPGHPAGRPGSAARSSDRCCQDPSLRGRAECSARRARAGDRVLPHRLTGAAPTRIDPRGNRPLSVLRACAGRCARRDGRLRRARGRGGHRSEPVGCHDADCAARHPRRCPACRSHRLRHRSRRSRPGPAGRPRNSPPTGICSARAASRSSAVPSRPSASSCSSCWPRTVAGSRRRCVSRSARASRPRPSGSRSGCGRATGSCRCRSAPRAPASPVATPRWRLRRPATTSCRTGWRCRSRAAWRRSPS